MLRNNLLRTRHEYNDMTAINPTQLEIVAAFLETSRDHLGVEYAFHLRWPPAAHGGRRAGTAARARTRPAVAKAVCLTAAKACVAAV